MSKIKMAPKGKKVTIPRRGAPVVIIKKPKKGKVAY